MARILFDEVSKIYDDDTLAVDKFNLEIEDGEFLTLVGPSGSGKSTLLRMVAGLEDITENEIHIGDKIVNNHPPRSRDIAMVFQSYALYPHLTVHENIAFGLKRSTDLSDPEIDDRVQEAAAMMGIEPHLDQKPKHLSGGQRQRVATGRAIVRDPSVFLFDEPLSNLDAKLRKHMRTEIRRIQNQLDTTTIYVTHDQEEAMTMSDRIAILNYGELQQVGSPRTVYNEPENVFVAQFIGSPSMNMFVSELDTDENLFVGDIDVSIDPERASAIAQNATSDELLLGIRPEHVTVHLEAVDKSVPASVDIIEPLGNNDLLYFDLEDGTSVEDIIANDLSIGEDEEKDQEEYKTFIRPGSVPNEYEDSDEVVYLTFDTDHMHVFDPTTGENIDVKTTRTPITPQTETAGDDD